MLKNDKFVSFLSYYFWTTILFAIALLISRFTVKTVDAEVANTVTKVEYRTVVLVDEVVRYHHLYVYERCDAVVPTKTATKFVVTGTATAVVEKPEITDTPTPITVVTTPVVVKTTPVVVVTTPAPVETTPVVIETTPVVVTTVAPTQTATSDKGNEGNGNGVDCPSNGHDKDGNCEEDPKHGVENDCSGIPGQPCKDEHGDAGKERKNP